MRIGKHILILALCLCLATEFACAQRSNGKHRYSRSKLSFKSPKIRGAKAKTICPVFENTGYPYHGIGFKVGDPLAVTYKYYANKHFSIGVDVGKASSGLYNRYYREKFEEYTQEGADTISADASITPSFHRVKHDWVGELKVLYHIEADKISRGLKAYFGAGWEVKKTRIQYDYFYNLQGPGVDGLVNNFRITYRERLTTGPQVVLGIEYAYFQLPISAFMEVELFTDVMADPGWSRFEGGVGLRYVF